MDDDNDDWLSAATEDVPSAGGGGGDGGDGDDWLSAAADTSADAVGDSSAAEDRSGKEWAWPKGVPVLKLPPYRVRRVQPRKLDKFIPFTHWSRPTSLNYDYIYQYRKSYYDDVIDYLDCRARGVNRDPPRPQTWAERVLRHIPPRGPNVPERMQITTSTTDDLKNVGKMGGLTHTDALHHVHSNTVIHRKYYDALYSPL